MRKFIALFLMINIISACSIEPSKIQYGKDACHFCQMTIVDQTHAAQIVTKKGKSFKYDAIECMLNGLNDQDNNEIELFLVTDFLKPKSLIAAKTATYLISPSIKSPMGANLSAFRTTEDAKKFMNSDADKLYNWQELQQQNFK